MRKTFALAAIWLAFAAVLAFASPSYAEILHFKADLKGSDEVPPNDTAGTGTLTATYDTATRVLTWEGSYSGLTGAPTAAHFHGPAEPGKNAGVKIFISQKDAPFATPFKGAATLTDDQAAELLSGRWYVNIHTDQNKGGELRGQLEKV